MTVFHNLCRDHYEFTAPPLSTVHDLAIRARSAQSSQKEKISSLRLRLLSQQYLLSFHTDRIDRAAVSPTTLAVLAPASRTSSISVCKFHASANHTSSIRIPRSSQDLGYPALVSELVSFGISTQHSCRSPSADCSHLKWKSQMVLPQHRQDRDDHSHTDPEPAIRLAYVSHVPD